MASNRRAVETHYARGDLGGAILAALKAAGKDLDHLSPDDLAPVDEFHGGQRPATVRLAELVGFTGTERVGTDGLLVGDLRKQTLDEIWKGDSIKALHRSFGQRKLHDVCRNCTMYRPV